MVSSDVDEASRRSAVVAPRCARFLATAVLAACLLLVWPTTASGADDPLPPFVPADSAMQRAFEQRADWQQFVATVSASRLLLDGTTGAPAHVWLRDPVLPARGADRALAESALTSYVRSRAALFGIDADDLVLEPRRLVVALDGRLVAADFAHVLHGIPVEGAHLFVHVARGNVVALGSERLAAARNLDPVPAVPAAHALRVALASAHVADASVIDAGSLLWVPRATPLGLEHVLAWRVTFRAPRSVATWDARVDARTGELLSLRDTTVEACDPTAPPPAGGKIRGGVVGKRLADAELVVAMPHAEVETASGSAVAADARGDLPPIAEAGTARLRGQHVVVICGSCTTPTEAAAPVLPSGGAEFGTGGENGVGNGLSTLAERTTYFQVERARMFASRWLEDAQLPARLSAAVNANWAGCNAFYFRDPSLLFMLDDGTCPNSGEQPDVIRHEWGHALDDAVREPFPTTWSEGVADASAWLARRASTFAPDFHRTTPFRLREMDEDLAPVLRVWPAADCSGEEHCVGEVYGQATWHLCRLLRADARIGEEAGWQLMEALFFLSLPLGGEIAPDVPGSAYDAIATVLEAHFGDGDVAAGVPLAAHLNDAFAHHGMTPAAPLPEEPLACDPPVDAPTPVVAEIAQDDTTARPRVLLSWSDPFGGVSWEILRTAFGAGHSLLRIGTVAAGTTTFTDTAAEPGATYHYLVFPVLPSGCFARMPAPVTATITLPLPRLEAVSLEAAGDATWLPGERLVATPAIRNVSDVVAPPGAPLTNLVATLTTDDPRVTIMQGDSAIGDLAPGSVAPGASWVVDLAPDAGACDAEIRFRVLMSSDEGCWTDGLTVIVGRGRADVALGALTFTDSPPAANGSGAIDPGESVDVAIEITHLGGDALTSPRGTLLSDDPRVTVVTADAPYPDLPASGTVAPLTPFRVSVQAGIACGERIPMTLAIVAAEGCFARSFMLPIGGSPADLVAESFESFARGWTVSGVPGQGIWQQADPLAIFGPVMPEYDVTPDGRLAFVTEVRSQIAGTDDVDQGCTVLTSPTWDLSGLGDVSIEYWRWFSSPGPSAEDRLVVEISNDGGGRFEIAEEIASPEPAWTRRSIDVRARFAAPGLLQLRFSACDDGADGTVEAAIDDVRISAPACLPPAPVVDLSIARVLADDGAAAGMGDADGVLEPGEVAAITLDLRNRGALQARSISARLSLAAPVAGVSVTQAAATWPDLAQGEVAAGAPTFEIALDTSAACGVAIPLRLDMTFDSDAGPGALAASHDLPTGAPSRGSVRAVAAFDDAEGGPGLEFLHVVERGRDDWERCTPAGLGGDPAAAFSGVAAWGIDLGCAPAGSGDGRYQASTLQRLIAAPLDLSRYDDVRLRFQRWLGVDDGRFDHARILVNDAVAWENPAGTDPANPGQMTIRDRSWTPVDLDISALADGSPSVTIAFELESDNAQHLSGWTLDDISVEGLLREPACSCDAPAAARLTSELRARKEGPGVRFDWSAYAGGAPAFNAYRSTDPTALPPRATPTPLASRARGATWLDPAPDGSLLFYIVRAVNGCGAE